MVKPSVSRSWIIILSLVLIGGCSPSPEAVKKDIPQKPTERAPTDPWRLFNYDRSLLTPAYLSNGLIGLRIGADGSGLDLSNRPLGLLPAFRADFYETTGEEKILVLPHPLAFSATVNNVPLSPEKAKNYQQEFNLKNGKITTSWTQRIGNEDVPVLVETHLDAASTEAAIGWKFRMESRPSFQLIRTDSGIVTKSLIEFEDFNRGWNLSTPEVTIGARVVPKETGLYEVSVRRVGSEKEKISTDPFAPQAADPILGNSDIEIDGPIEDQLFVRSAIFNLKTSLNLKSTNSVPPMALSDDRYFGHIFWDADIWVFPAMVFLDPAKARKISEYRLDRFEQAKQNYKEWLAAGRPTGSGKVTGAFNPKLIGAKFPWESSVSGKETVPGPSKFQDHITGTVAFSLGKARDLGLISSSKVAPVIEAAKNFYLARSEPSTPREIKGTMSPDEHHIGNNDLYTNLLAEWTANKGNFSPQPSKFKLPKDSESFMTYDDDPVRSYKQTAALLSVWPLQYPGAERQAAVLMARFGDKTTDNGPSMSDSIHALILARLGQKEAAYKEWRKSWQDFVKPPFLLFSEKRRTPTTYFITGAAGCLNSVIYGFAGVHIDTTPKAGALWSKKLKTGKFISIKPNLPEAWKSIKMKGFVIDGISKNIFITNKSVMVE